MIKAIILKNSTFIDIRIRMKTRINVTIKKPKAQNHNSLLQERVL